MQTSPHPQLDSPLFENMDIREIPDEQLEDLIGGSTGMMTPASKME